jgi:7-keto-8-aminopelargonate synthetase-like enzyme
MRGKLFGIVKSQEITSTDTDAAIKYRQHINGTRMMSGLHSVHEQLENELAACTKNQLIY